VPEQPAAMERLAGRVRDALAAADLEAYRDLLAPGVTWGPPGHDFSCRDREQVIAWYARARAAGARARVTETTVSGDHILVGLAVTGRDGAPSGGERRWQVLTVWGGRVAVIEGFETRAEAAARAGVLPS